MNNLSNTLAQYGWMGVFGVSLLDSAFVPMPSGPDLLLVLGLTLQTTPLNVVTYVLAATIGSTIGCTLLYLFARRVGVSALKHVSQQKRDYVQNMLGRYDALALIVASLMPPPFPFKPFILSAGVFNFKLPRFIAALMVGRVIRYFALAMLAFYFGKEAINLIKSHGPRILIVIVAVGVIAYAVHYFKTRNKNKEA